MPEPLLFDIAAVIPPPGVHPKLLVWPDITKKWQLTDASTWEIIWEELDGILGPGEIGPQPAVFAVFQIHIEALPDTMSPAKRKLWQRYCHIMKTMHDPWLPLVTPQKIQMYQNTTATHFVLMNEPLDDIINLMQP